MSNNEGWLAGLKRPGTSGRSRFVEAEPEDVGVAGVVGMATLASTEVSVRVSRSSNASSPGVENPGLQSTGVLERSLAFSTENSSSVMRPSSRSSFRFRSNDGLFAMHDCMEMDHLSDEVSPRSHRLLQTHVQAHVNVD